MTLPGFVIKGNLKYLEDIYMKGTETANNYSQYSNRLHLSLYSSPPVPRFYHCDKKCIDVCYYSCAASMPPIYPYNEYYEQCWRGCKSKCCDNI